MDFKADDIISHLPVSSDDSRDLVQHWLSQDLYQPLVAIGGQDFKGKAIEIMVGYKQIETSCNIVWISGILL